MLWMLKPICFLLKKREVINMRRAISSIDTILLRLGYLNSSNLLYDTDIESYKAFSKHTIKVLLELSPYAIYVIDDRPFILFFDETRNSKSINKKIWNAQIPVSIFCGVDTIRVLNGCSIDQSTYFLNEIIQESIEKCSETGPFSYWETSNPAFWNNYVKEYSSTRLNEVLLDNITYITQKLKNEYELSFATKLVLRVIFIRYLIDRGVDLDYGRFSTNIEDARIELLTLLKDKESIYNLFTHLKGKFNGNLFDLGQEINDIRLTQDVFNLLADFLSGKECMSNGQRSFFELYDFNIIPVELISNIYEILLGKEAQIKDNAFYTPNYLVEYILDETVSRFLKKKEKFAILDPACGSGIFLVDSYRRMVEKNLDGDLYSDNDIMLRELLEKNIYGIDINEEAIDVAIFSLYLTVLDYKDPKTLVKFNLPNLKGVNLLACDFFDDCALKQFETIKFDFVIGNPPWGSERDGLHMQYCKERGFKKLQQNAEISRSFVFRARDFSNEDTQCCFILHSKLLYTQKQPSKNFREFFLSNTEITKIIEMSSVRKLVFKNADAPAVIIKFKYTNKECLKNRITYISLKPNVFFKLFNLIVIEKSDIKHIEQNLLKEHDWAWKTVVFGLSGDIDVIMSLKNRYPTIKSELTRQSPQLIMGAGVEDQDGDRKDAHHLLGKKVLDSKNGVDHFFVNTSNTTLFKKKEIHRPRNPQLFQPPYCLIPKGVNCSNYKMRAAYSEESFISKTTMYIIKGSLEQKLLLLNLVGLINSSFYSYLNLMLGSSIGIEREQRLMDIVMQFPYTFKEDIAKQTERIQSLKEKTPLENFNCVEEEIEKLDELILEAFKLSDNVFVDYALKIQIPQLAGSSDTDSYRKVNKKDLLNYSKCFDEYFSAVYGKANKYIAMNLYTVVAERYAIFELKVCNKMPANKIKFHTIADMSKEKLSKFAVYKTNDLFYQIRDIAYFDESSFFIIKPNHYKNWHPAIARLDLMDIIDQILSVKGVDQ